MKSTKEILVEKSGVPLVINSYVDNIKRYFHKNGFAPFEHKFTFGAKENFPLKAINIKFEVNDMFGLKEPAFNGAYSPNTVKEVEGGFEIDISVEIVTGDRDAIQQNELASLTGVASVLTHELTHAYEDYQRKKKTKIGLNAASGSVTSRVASALMNNEDIPPSLNIFLHLMYCAASFEVSARTAQVYPFIKGIKDPKQRLEKVKETMPWKVANQMSNFSFEAFESRFVREVQFQCILGRLTPTDYFNGLVNSIEQLMSKANTEDVTGLLNSLHLPEQEAPKVMQAIKIVSDNASKVLNKKPYAFFQYWIKVINKAGEKSKKKILKMTYNGDF